MINPKAALASAGCILLMVLAGFIALGQVPADARIATHFAGDGTPNGWMHPFPAFFVAPALAAVIWLSFLVLPHFGKRGAALARMPRAYAVLWALPVIIAGPVDLMVTGPTLGLSWAAFRLVPAATGLLFILLGNVMGKLPPNPFIGIRTPWTRADDRVWDKTHRFGGWVFLIGGFVILGSALLLPRDRVFPPVTLVVTLFAAALCTVKSWLLSRDQQRR